MDNSLEHRRPFARQNSDGLAQRSIVPQASFSGADHPGSYEYFNDDEAQFQDHDQDDDRVALVGSRDSFGDSVRRMPTSDSPYGDEIDDTSPFPVRAQASPGHTNDRETNASLSGLGISSMQRNSSRPPQGVQQRQAISIDTALSNTFPQSTAYDRSMVENLPLAHPEYVIGSPISIRKPSLRAPPPMRQRTQIQRIAQSFRSNTRYARIDEDREEDNEDPSDVANSRIPLSPTEAVGFDISSMGGFNQTDSVPLQSVGRGSTRRGHRFTPSSEEARLESNGQLTGGLGTGMGTVRGLRLGRNRTTRSGDAALSPVQDYSMFSENFDSNDRKAGQDLANKFNQIIAVEETIDFDVTQADGGQVTPQLNHTPAGGKQGDNQHSTTHSYYYPDVEQPDWKPIVMRWWYIATITVLALALAGVQEFLVQRSQQLTHGNQGGLLQFYSPKDVSLVDYFAWKYLPTIVLLTYGVMWQVTDYEVKRLEPYFQLARPLGSTAERSLSLNYLTSFAIVVPFKALLNGHWAVLYSSTATLISSSLVPILQSPSLNMFPDPQFRKIDELKFVRVDPVWSRVTEAFLIVPAIAGVLLFIQLRRRSGLRFDPKGIAGLAAMATRSHILVDFKDLDRETPKNIHKRLRRRRYVLHNSCIWQGEYVKSSDRPSKAEEEAVVKSPHPFVFRRSFGYPYMISLLFFMGLIPVFMFTGANIATQKAPWLLTALATALKVVWSNLDGNCRLLEPFYVLSERNAHPKALTLDYTGTVFGWMPIKAFLNKHYLAAAVSFGAVLGEILVVCVSSFDVDGRRFIAGHGDDGTSNANSTDPTLLSPRLPQGHSNMTYGGDSEANDRYNSSETFRSFWISFGLCLGILAFLIIVAGLVYLRRSHAFLPREPDSIASVLSYIHQSNMLYDFTNADDEEVPIEDLDNAMMTDFLERKGKRYGLGWFRGRDGKGHMGVDEEPLLGKYEHGKDWNLGVVDSVGTWDRF